VAHRDSGTSDGGGGRDDAPAAAARGIEGGCQVAVRMEGGCPAVAATAGIEGGSMPGSGSGSGSAGAEGGVPAAAADRGSQGGASLVNEDLRTGHG
jgi:hypothetical protein